MHAGDIRKCARSRRPPDDTPDNDRRCRRDQASHGRDHDYASQDQCESCRRFDGCEAIHRCEKYEFENRKFNETYC